MDGLPSYHEATTSPDWLSLVASFIPVGCWQTCCLVDRRFYRQFNPRLWQDPLVVIRQLGLHPNDDLTWYRRFINKHIQSARLETRSMVRSLDFRDFALRASGLYSTEASERAISNSFRTIPHDFPKLNCLLLDGHPELDPGSLATNSLSAHSLELLDLANCRQELTPKLFNPAFFRDLVYLDVSYVPGSLKTAIQSTLNPRLLPELRVFKARGREMDDATASLLFLTFGRQLWSLDLSNNKLTDRIIDDIVEHCFSSLSFHTDAHFEREGKLTLPRNIGSRSCGPFEFIEESEHSLYFNHPERYFADSPLYSQRADQTELQEWQVIRSNGLGPLKRDDAKAFKQLLLDDATAGATGPLMASYHGDIRIAKGGITHLYLGGNRVTTLGVERLLRNSSGRLEHFECDSCFHVPAPGRTRVTGLLGSAHLFRPVVSSNLRSLEVHHSLVTRVPTIAIEGQSLASTSRLAEGPLFKNIRRAYPQGFEPDMNPRISSLTLTHIPARSRGAIIEQLTGFLDLVSAQQKAIKQAATISTGRGPSVLKGLRHLRLEIEPDFTDDSVDSSTGRDVDFDKLLDPGDEDFSNDTFSFFEDESRGISSRSKSTTRASAVAGPGGLAPYSHWTSGRLKSFPYTDTQSEYLNYQPELSESWTGNMYSIPVWIGSGTIGSSAALNEYMWNLQDQKLCSNVGPATPNHVAAGVPPLSYIFYAAWDAMILPRDVQAAVKRAGPAPFRDVAAAIKEYRFRKRGTADHWEGQIELVRTKKASRYQSSEYWR
ncbi:Uu.00g077220.m01.CDS01 [Anthostomella pinea]|uniref:Uu.00g077220.m01.CDS01 n=1 Tax=Anthostomella pinea TaxID=933095 RepID=A0AAI8VVZ1_9PEZI|nr:Uu.00g077220.m01.CDS01 [Anthostomella pinea]